MMKHVLSLVCMLSIWACAHGRPGEVPDAQTKCETDIVSVDANFPSAGMYSCAIVNPRTVEVFLKPENVPINPSPWYAVRLTPHETGPVRVILRYQEHPHRYAPKISRDGMTWQYVPASDVDVKAEGYRVTVHLNLDDKATFLASQELFTNAIYDDWIAEMATRPFITHKVIGHSVANRPIQLLQTHADHDAAKTVIFIGRQHPPETTGGQAMIAFLEEIFGDSHLADHFREQFNILTAPNMNPDGVENGHWRHNLGGIDLNRDWGPFTQPETQSLKKVLDDIDQDPNQELALFLDFHSTRPNVFYTQEEGRDGTTYDFTANWLSRSRKRIPEYDFTREGSHQLDLPTSKTYVHERFKVPAITYELGDETNRQLIQDSAKVFAQELMRLMLEEES